MLNDFNSIYNFKKSNTTANIESKLSKNLYPIDHESKTVKILMFIRLVLSI